MDDSESPLEFPCRFPVKIMGHDSADFETHIVELISQHTGPISTADITARTSSKGKYVALTVTILAESREQLDEIYRTLSASEHVVYLI